METAEPTSAGSPLAGHDLLGLTASAFIARLQQEVGHTARFHRPLYRQLMQRGRMSPRDLPVWHEMAPCAQERLERLLPSVELPDVITVNQAEDPTHGTTRKLLLRLADGAQVETVLIPMRSGAHQTVCVSSQVGCRMGCGFCHTASMGLIRHLGAHEIVGQVLAARGVLGGAVRNVVFMGMGEPMDNLESVAQAVRVLTDRSGLAIAPRHITVSTVGRIDGLLRWSQLGLEGVNLAISLGTADEALRSELMPVNRSSGLVQLKRTLAALPLGPGRRLLISCIVIPGVTDAPVLVRKLIDWLADLPVLVNLIPFNPIPGRSWRAPTDQDLEAMRQQLDHAGIPVRVRTTKGRSAMAACGQLATTGQPRPSTPLAIS